VTRRLHQVIVVGYFCAALDRANVGMAATTMRPDLGFSNTVFGFGAGLFFWGYLLAEIPSALVLNRMGARRWISRIPVRHLRADRFLWNATQAGTRPETPLEQRTGSLTCGLMIILSSILIDRNQFPLRATAAGDT
jgi:MFS family permease